MSVMAFLIICINSLFNSLFRLTMNKTTDLCIIVPLLAGGIYQLPVVSQNKESTMPRFHIMTSSCCVLFSRQVWDLLADIGGVFGFWLGLSVVALFEFLELLIDVIIVGVRLARHKNEVRAFKGETNPTC